MIPIIVPYRDARIKLNSDSFHAVLALSCGPAKFQYAIISVTVVFYHTISVYRMKRMQFILKEVLCYIHTNWYFLVLSKLDW